MLPSCIQNYEFRKKFRICSRSPRLRLLFLNRGLVFCIATCRYIGLRSYCHSTFADLSSRYSPSAQAHQSHVSRWIRCICFHGLWFYGTGNSFRFCLADSAGIGRYSALGRTRHLGRSFRILSSTISPFSLIMISVSSPAGMLD